LVLWGGGGALVGGLLVAVAERSGWGVPVVLPALLGLVVGYLGAVGGQPGVGGRPSGARPGAWLGALSYMALVVASYGITLWVLSRGGLDRPWDALPLPDHLAVRMESLTRGLLSVHAAAGAPTLLLVVVEWLLASAAGAAGWWLFVKRPLVWPQG
jgi:hypothetical protein